MAYSSVWTRVPGATAAVMIGLIGRGSDQGNTQSEKSLYRQSSIDFRCYLEMALSEPRPCPYCRRNTVKRNSPTKHAGASTVRRRLPLSAIKTLFGPARQLSKVAVPVKGARSQPSRPRGIVNRSV